MAEWGLCSTIRAPTDQVLAFVAHHLSLGADHLWLFFDDPDDPAADAVSGIAEVTVTRCDEAYWHATCKTRPESHQNRQTRNIHRVYKTAALPWIGHIDVDEFLLPARPIAEILGEVRADRITVRIAPWEALHDPSLPADIFTARHFRAAIKGGAMARARLRAFGAYAGLLTAGVLSHAAGKCFFQRGFRGLQPRLHGAYLHGERVKGDPFHPDLALLHFHAEDPDRWKHRLQFRLTRGAYRSNPALQARLLASSPAEIDDFYAAVQTADPEVLSYLAAKGLLKEVNLGLRAKVDALLNSTGRK